MVKKLTIFDRRKLLEARQRGLTDSQIKAEFGITDNRTLKRHLKLAEQEYEARLVKAEILKDALTSHLAEVRSLIEEWGSARRAPEIYQVYKDTGVPTQTIEANPLFESVKEHLPFPTLWRDYSAWKKKIGEYINSCKELRRKIRESWKIGETELAFSFEEPIIRAMTTAETKFWYSLHVVVGHDLADLGYQSLVVNQHETVTGRKIEPSSNFYLLEHDKCKKAILPTEYQKVAAQLLKSDLVAQLNQLLLDIKDVEANLHNSLQEILLRRDYIMYTCRLCPGQPRLVR